MANTPPVTSKRKYDASFKSDVIGLIVSGRTVAEIARSLGIGENLIYRWRKQAVESTAPDAIGTPAAAAGSPHVLLSEHLALQKRLREVEMERDILKKCSGHLQQASVNERFRFIHIQQLCYPIQVLCRVLGVSRSAYYAYLTPKEVSAEQKKLEGQIAEVFTEHKRRYGVRRLCRELKDRQIQVGSHRCRRIMKQQGLQAIQPRSFVPRTTQSRHPYPIAPNLLLNRAAPAKPDEVWVGDITYLPLKEGRWAYLAVWMDLYSRRIVGRQLYTHMREELVATALVKALRSRQVKPGLLLHSDRGGQYAGKAFRKLLKKKGIVQSMSRADDPYDNAWAESYFSRLKAEVVQNGVFEDLQDARTEIFEYIEMYYNTQRKHSSLNHQSPMQYENRYFYSLTKQVNCL